jgi:hypothetical protein
MNKPVFLWTAANSPMRLLKWGWAFAQFLQLFSLEIESH